MIILTLRTDKPQSEVGVYENKNQLAYKSWEAHRSLAETLHKSIEQILQEADKSLANIGGIVCFKGPGSFTGLRIGLSVANTLAYSLNVPIVGIKGEQEWLEKGLQAILDAKNEVTVMPEYGSPVHITEARK